MEEDSYGEHSEGEDEGPTQEDDGEGSDGSDLPQEEMTAKDKQAKE